MNKKYLEISDFEYVDFGGMKIYADLCKVYKGVGVLLYKNKVLVSHIKTDVQEVSLVEIADIKEHYYLRGASGVTLYLHKKKEKKKQFSVNTEVVLKEDDRAFKLMCAVEKHPKFLEEYYDELKPDVIWTVVENFEDKVLRVQKGNQEKYVNSSDVATLGDINEGAAHFREVSEELKEKANKQLNMVLPTKVNN